MNKLLLALLVCFSTIGACAQQWSVYGGASADYDGFLRDASIATVKNKWPFAIGGAIVLGGGYKANNGFDIFAETNLGITNIKLPIPDVNSAEEYLGLLVAKAMVGSGPRIKFGEDGNSFTPFIQIGGAYLNITEARSSSSNGDYLLVHKNELGQSHWAILFGAGIDYEFGAKVPSSINLNFSYSPLNVFRNPYNYEVTTTKGIYNIHLQGKLLQVALSYRVHLNLGRRDS